MTDWPRVQLRRIARFAYGESLPEEARREGVVPVYGSNGPVGAHDRPNTAGPVIVVGRKGSHGKVQFSERPVFSIDTTYYVDGSTTRHDLRWLYYALLALNLDARSTDVGVPGLSREAAYSERVRLPSLPVQRAIADFLDAETVRVDALIAKKRGLLGLLADRQQAAIDRAMQDTGAPVALRRLITRLTSGPRGWSERAGDVGSPFIRITNVQRRSISLNRDDLLRVEDPGTAEADRTRVKSGDVLVSITADIGSVGLATTEEEGAFVSQHVALVTPADGAGEWIAYAIKSTASQQALAAGQYGGTKTQLALGDLASLSIPFPNTEIRQVRLRRLSSELEGGDAAMEKLERQLRLLSERRQALITAAVTGELDIPGVAA